MKKTTPLYIPLVLLLLFVGSVFFIHFGNARNLYGLFSREFEIPFFRDGSVQTMSPEAAAAGFELGDRLIGLNGRLIKGATEYAEVLLTLRDGEPVAVMIERRTADGGTERLERSVMPQRFDRNFAFYSRVFIALVWIYVIPTFCVLLGFWVVFVRPRDPLAWILLFVLLGIASNGLENYDRGSLGGSFRALFFNTWALSMILFGIYFPERWSFDKKFPWAKWILIAPLSFQLAMGLLTQFKLMTGLDLVRYFDFISNPYEQIAAILNLTGIGVFFAALAHKSATLENPDARRRLRLTLYGTTAAMLPAFLIVLYAALSGKTGSFFDFVPWWFAVFALFMVLLFPLTMAYVIVVHRAMDVGVVIRQGLQYALARNGVKALQFILLTLVILGVISIFRSDRFDFAAQLGFVAAGFAVIPLIDYVAKNLRVWVDRKFFRDAYDAEQILSELSENVRTMVETKPLLETVSTKISESLHVPQIALLLRNGNEFEPAYALGFETPPAVLLSEDDRAVEKLRRNEPLTVYQDEADSWVNEEAAAAEREKLRELNSQLLLPIGAKDSLAGVISLSPKRSEEPYTPNDLRLLKSVAVQTGLALENSRLTEAIAREAAQKERLNRELEIAREVQERLFPQELPPTEGLDYTGACRPALGVGGDYYDFLELPDHQFGIAIGDVSGKGIGASLMMASLQASLRGQAIHCGSDLAALMKHVNTLVYEASTSNRYATFFYAQLDTRTRRLIYVNAGHNPPFLLRKNGDVLRLEEGGAVVGMLPSMFVNYTQGEIQLEPGDLLVGYTDGISEAMNPDEEEWGEDAMLAELKAVYEKSSEEILDHIVAGADRFAAGAKQHDDMTMIIVRII
ncbi:MAG: SpoIIE family protein phosphatase [Acidobacteria bacterium]|nr:SpoIIE family protein phosphatase [Acidobacteriota bacterium]